MTHRSFSAGRHSHIFDGGNIAGERSTHAVMWITLAMMVVEIAAGWWTHSMALLADGFHMSSHVVAIGLSAFAYTLARRHANDARYAFGTWKIEVLAGFASALFLLLVVGLMAIESIQQLVHPQPIQYREAIVVAVLGLLVNLVSALILGAAHHHGHGHEHEHEHHAHHHDLNLKSAYVHVLADAGTSVLAIVALLGGWWGGWAWLDPVIGLVGSVVVALWAKQLIADTARVLLDREMDHPVVEQIRQAVQTGAAGHSVEITDLHVWRVGKSNYACVLSLTTANPQLSSAQAHQWLAPVGSVVHLTVEVWHKPPQ